MAKMLRSLLFVLLLFTATSLGQVQQFTLEVNAGLAQLSLPSLIVNESLDNVPRIFQVTILPEGVNVKLQGEVLWTPVNSSTPRKIYSFITRPFSSRSFNNIDLDRGDIKIESDDEGDTEVIDELRKLGTLTGKVDISLVLTDLSNNTTHTQIKTLSFDNPTQTLQVVSPFPGSVEDPGGVIASWDPIIGAKSYKITLVQKRSKDQSDEDALTSGQPLIKDKDVGNRTSVNLRTLLDRQWVPGMELVFQVKAVTDAAGGELDLESQPTNFFIEDPNDETKDIVDPLALVDLILQGTLRIDQIKSVRIDGKPVDPQILLQLLRRLSNNPDLIVNKRFSAK